MGAFMIILDSRTGCLSAGLELMCGARSVQVLPTQPSPHWHTKWWLLLYKYIVPVVDGLFVICTLILSQSTRIYIIYYYYYIIKVELKSHNCVKWFH